MTPQEAEKRVHEACPCRRAAQSGSTFDLSRECAYRMEGCACAGHSPGNPCKSPLHQAARDLRKVCAEAAKYYSYHAAAAVLHNERISKEGE